MSKNTRWALAIVGVVIIIVAAVVVGTGKDDTEATPASSDNTPAAPGETGSAGTTGESGGASGGGGSTSSGGATAGSGGDEGSGGAGPQAETGGASARGAVILRSGTVQTITVDKGDAVTIQARSSQPAQVHLHGYDKSIELEPGKTGTLRFRANIDGEFEIEFENTGEKIGVLKVNP